MHMYAYIDIYLYTHIYVYMYVWIYIYIHTCMCICTYVLYIYLYIYHLKHTKLYTRLGFPESPDPLRPGPGHGAQGLAAAGAADEDLGEAGQSKAKWYQNNMYMQREREY